MRFRISCCKACGACIEPWKLRCPKCGRLLPIVGAVAFLAILFIFLGAYFVLVILKRVTGWPPFI